MEGEEGEAALEEYLKFGIQLLFSSFDDGLSSFAFKGDLDV